MEHAPTPHKGARSELSRKPGNRRRRKKQHTHRRSERDAQGLRVRRIVGQLNASERMLEEDRDGAEILMELVSARKALKLLAGTLIPAHLQHGVEHAHSPAEGRKHLQELPVVLKREVE